MGDRTNIDLYVRDSDKDQVLSLLEGLDFSSCSMDIEDGGNGLIEFNFYEMNWAEIGIESDLQERSIPYDKYWSAGHEYPAGEEHFRIDAQGKPELKAFLEGLRGMVSLSAVKAAFDGGTLADFLSKAEEESHYLPLLGQESLSTNLTLKAV